MREEEEGKKQLCNEKRRRIERQQISDLRMSTDGKPGASYTYFFFFKRGTCGEFILWKAAALTFFTFKIHWL